MKMIIAVVAICFAFTSFPVKAANIDISGLHTSFTKAFNGRDWNGLKGQLADDIVFHRASGTDVFIGSDAVMARFKDTIGAQKQWNVKFAILNSTSSFTGTEGGVVERGDFAVTAGGDDGSCYRGAYMMTWAEVAGSWKLKLLAWQDVQTALANCK